MMPDSRRPDQKPELDAMSLKSMATDAPKLCLNRSPEKSAGSYVRYVKTKAS